MWNSFLAGKLDVAGLTSGLQGITDKVPQRHARSQKDRRSHRDRTGHHGGSGPGRKRHGPGPGAVELTFDHVSFMVVFLGLPLAIFLVFVISPFVQACYYAMTDWSGFSPNFNFVGFGNYTKLAQDDIFRRSVLQQHPAGDRRAAASTIVIALHARHRWSRSAAAASGGIRGLRNSGFYRVVSFFPYTVPAIVIGIIWAQIYDPQRTAERHPHRDRAGAVQVVRLAR